MKDLSTMEFLIKFHKLKTKHLSIMKYDKDPDVDIAKGRKFPYLRGTFIPSFDTQPTWSCGVAINWLWIRVEIIWKTVTLKE